MFGKLQIPKLVGSHWRETTFIKPRDDTYPKFHSSNMPHEMKLNNGLQPMDVLNRPSENRSLLGSDGNFLKKT